MREMAPLYRQMQASVEISTLGQVAASWKQLEEKIYKKIWIFTPVAGRPTIWPAGHHLWPAGTICGRQQKSSFWPQLQTVITLISGLRCRSFLSLNWSPGSILSNGGSLTSKFQLWKKLCLFEWRLLIFSLNGLIPIFDQPYLPPPNSALGDSWV